MQLYGPTAANDGTGRGAMGPLNNKVPREGPGVLDRKNVCLMK